MKDWYIVRLVTLLSKCTTTAICFFVQPKTAQSRKACSQCKQWTALKVHNTMGSYFPAPPDTDLILRHLHLCGFSIKCWTDAVSCLFDPLDITCPGHGSAVDQHVALCWETKGEVKTKEDSLGTLMQHKRLPVHLMYFHPDLWFLLLHESFQMFEICLVWQLCFLDSATRWQQICMKKIRQA